VRVRVAAACVGVLLLAACQGTEPNPPASTAPTSPTPTVTSTEPTGTPTPAVATQAWRLDLAPLTQPVFVDGVAVVLARGGQGSLALVGVDPQRGRRLWTRPATTSGVSAEEPLAVSVVGGDVAYFRPAGTGGAARLVVADPHTGNDKVTSPVEVFSTPIQPCDTPVTRLCGTARSPQDITPARYSFLVSSGRFGPAPGDATPPGSRPVGPGGLVDLGDRAPERVGVFQNGQLLWSMPVVAYFPEGTTTDAGWKFMLQGDHYIGSLDQPYPADGELDMADIATASFEAATGRIAWSVRGTSLNCRGLAWLAPDVPVRCHYSGKAIFTKGVADFSDVEVRLEGFDPGNGKRTWVFELGPNPPILHGARVPALIGAESLLLGKPGNQTVLDLGTGETSQPERLAIYLCPSLTTFASPRGPVSGDMLLEPCLAPRDHTVAVPSAATLLSLHQQVGDTVVIATPQGLTGYRIG
jgi:hypothetical protein